MVTDDIPSTAELWALVQQQQERTVQLEAKAAEVDELKAELERQRLEKRSLDSRLAEVEGGHDPSGKKLSRAGLLKAAAAGAAGLAGAGLLSRPEDAAAAANIMYTETYNNSGQHTALVAVTYPSTSDYPDPYILAIYPDNVHAISGNFDGIWGFGHGTGSGVVGVAPNVANPVPNQQAGVYGTSVGTGGAGVIGEGDNYGVYGIAHSNLGDAVTGQGGRYGGSFSGDRAPLHLDLQSGAVPPNPVSIPNVAGDIWLGSGDPGQAVAWLCTRSATGLPATWVPFMHGNSTDGTNNALLTAVSTQQYTLSNSDGVTWVDMDAAHLALSITPQQNSLAIIGGNSDLWTSQAGYNQDLGISISGGSYPTNAGQPEAWKESGGFAGTFSPNAAFVQTVLPLVAATAYTIKLQWKANKNASGATIWAGAGPIGGKFSPTRLTALLIPTP